jgi:hypothetical protein
MALNNMPFQQYPILSIVYTSLLFLVLAFFLPWLLKKFLEKDSIISNKKQSWIATLPPLLISLILYLVLPFESELFRRSLMILVFSIFSIFSIKFVYKLDIKTVLKIFKLRYVIILLIFGILSELGFNETLAGKLWG